MGRQSEMVSETAMRVLRRVMLMALRVFWRIVMVEAESCHIPTGALDWPRLAARMEALLGALAAETPHLTTWDQAQTNRASS